MPSGVAYLASAPLAPLRGHVDPRDGALLLRVRKGGSPASIERRRHAERRDSAFYVRADRAVPEAGVGHRKKARGHRIRLFGGASNRRPVEEWRRPPQLV